MTDINKDDLSNFKCNEECFRQGFVFSGTAGGSRCFCGNKTPPDSSLEDMTECDKVNKIFLKIT